MNNGWFERKYDRALLLELACKQGLAPVEVARRVGCSVSLVYQVRTGNDLSLRKYSVDELLVVRDCLRDRVLRTRERIRAVNRELRRRRR